MSNDNALETLAEKLNGLDLTDAEETVLAVIIAGKAEEVEVGGFADGLSAEIRGFNIGMPPTIIPETPSPGKGGGRYSSMHDVIVSSYSVWIGGS